MFGKSRKSILYKYMLQYVLLTIMPLMVHAVHHHQSPVKRTIYSS